MNQEKKISFSDVLVCKLLDPLKTISGGISSSPWSELNLKSHFTWSNKSILCKQAIPIPKDTVSAITLKALESQQESFANFSYNNSTGLGEMS